jgi:putative ABC transport system permease protein
VVCFLILRLASGGLLKLIRTSLRPHSMPIRYGLSNLSRPGNQTHTVIFSIGLGVTIILAIYFVQFSLTNEIRENLPSDAPSLFFIDIQRDQTQGVESILSKETSITASELTPIVRARVHSINGTSIEEIKVEPSSNWYYSREYVVTFKQDLPKHNTIEKGEWWTQKELMESPLISVEKEAAEGLNMDVGSKIVFDIQGVQVPATVSSIREEDWGSMTTNFYMIFSPGSLDGVPLNYIATARLPREGETALQNQMVRHFPNISTINLRDILDTVSIMLDRMGQVIRFMAGFSIFAGLVVLSNSISASRVQRIRETAIYKTLGATRPMLLQGFAVEFVLVGMIAGVIGVTLSTLVGWITVHFILEMKWHFSIWGFFLGILFTMGLTLLTGIFSSYRILGQKPLPILKAE